MTSLNAYKMCDKKKKIQNKEKENKKKYEQTVYLFDFSDQSS